MTPRTQVKVPARISRLPLDPRNYAVPFFVAWIDGKPDFRVIDPEKLYQAIKLKLCWICGGPLGSHLAFILGPMCVVNRIISEPPSHKECATYSLQVCPFLTLPKAQRREANLPTNVHDSPGIPIERNPGASCLWITKKYSPVHAPNGILFRVGEPLEMQWWREGRAATHREVIDSIESGLSVLRTIASEEGAEVALAAKVSIAMKLVEECFP